MPDIIIDTGVKNEVVKERDACICLISYDDGNSWYINGGISFSQDNALSYIPSGTKKVRLLTFKLPLYDSDSQA